MQVRRLSWAGVEVQADGESVVIDLLGGAEAFEQWLGPVEDDFVQPAAGDGGALGAFLTHSHFDHFDPEALRRALAPGAPVHCPRVMADAVAGAGFEARGVAAWDTLDCGPFSATAVPAVDGVADVQLSWVVEHGDRRLIHCGDTLFHGAWWPIRERTGPFDVAFLPINGALVDFPPLQPATGLPAVMTPEQAAAAAHVLGAGLAVPMHYGVFHHPPLYVSLPDPEPAFLAAAAGRGVSTRVMRPGDVLDLSAVPA